MNNGKNSATRVCRAPRRARAPRRSPSAPWPASSLQDKNLPAPQSRRARRYAVTGPGGGVAGPGLTTFVGYRERAACSAYPTGVYALNPVDTGGRAGRSTTTARSHRSRRSAPGRHTTCGTSRCGRPARTGRPGRRVPPKRHGDGVGDHWLWCGWPNVRRNRREAWDDSGRDQEADARSRRP